MPESSASLQRLLLLMTLRPESALLRWLPPDSRRGVAQRMGIVWAVALLICLLYTSDAADE